MPRPSTPHQLALFDPPSDPERVPAPEWKNLPAEARLTLTELMVRLILDHADGADSQGEKAGHDA